MRTLNHAEWAIIKARYVKGEFGASLAKEYGISGSAVSQKAKRDGWVRNPEGIGVAVAAAPVRRERRKSSPDTMIRANPSENVQNATLAMPEIPANATPEQFQSILGAFVQSLMVQGLANIEPPRNLAELEKLNAIHRKAAGLDKVNTGNGASPLVAPMRTVSRRPVDVVTVEVEDEGWDDPVELV